MLVKTSRHAAGHITSVVRSSMQHRSPSSVRGFCAIVLICAAACLSLRAQSADDPCDWEVLKPNACPPAKPAKGKPQTKEDQTKAALACEWTNVDRRTWIKEESTDCLQHSSS